jgi:hypothetical protein
VDAATALVRYLSKRGETTVSLTAIRNRAEFDCEVAQAVDTAERLGLKVVGCMNYAENRAFWRKRGLLSVK